MTTLREQIKENHDLAEQSKFTQLLLSGNIPKNIYADYLNNQYEMYKVLEEVATNFGLLDEFPEIKRADLIKQDLDELNIENLGLNLSTIQYIKYIHSITNPKLLWAHIYVRHFGDMYGGQMIKKVIPSSGKMYEFEDRTGLIAKVRAKLTDDLGDEANRCFEFAIQLFNELEHEYNIQ